MIPLLIVLFISGCKPNNASSTNEDLFQFKGSYVGDNSAIGNLTFKLVNGEYLEGFELKTAKEPYGIILNYRGIEAKDLVKEYKETVIYNATFIFALVQNADWISFNFDDQQYKITKENLQDWYGENLSKLKSEEEISKITQEYLDNEIKVDQLFD